MVYNLTRRAVLAVYTVIILVPLLVVVFGSLKTNQELFGGPFAPPADPQVGNYATILGGSGLGVAFRNSVVVTGISVPLTLFLASLAAFGIARLPGRRSAWLFALFVLGMAVPAQANMIPQYVQFETFGLTDSLVGLVLINIVVTLPIAVFIMTGFLRTLPAELFEAAAIGGAGPWRTYRSIALPVAAPSLSATAIFLFVIHWNDLLYPLLFIHDPAKRTIPVALLSFQGEFLTDYPLLFAGVVVASAPIVLAYVFLQRYFVAGMTAGAVKG